MRRVALLVCLLSCAAGLFFAGFSTHDFVQHLDRQVHGIHCSFVPGLSNADVSGTSGCHVTLMSPYSSVLRTHVWGGIPVSLPAMGVFAFLFAFAASIGIRRRLHDRGATGFLVAATALPVLTSGVMGYISFVELGAACKLCIGIYTASGLAFLSALALRFAGGSASWAEIAATDHDLPLADDLSAVDEPRGNPVLVFGGRFALGVLFVALSVGIYVGLAPDFERFVGSCGELADPADPYDVMVSLTDPGTPVAGDRAEAIEIFDPLCPSCRGFEHRLRASGLASRLDRKALLFPLDNECNWMVGSAVHPGACVLSEAVLCAADEGAVTAVIDWTFARQEQLLTLARDEGSEALRDEVSGAFPGLSRCLGSTGVRSKLNRSLRWAVANKLPVLTPQLYVEGTKLCDEDTDLGMDFALSRLLDKKAAGDGVTEGTR